MASFVTARNPYGGLVGCSNFPSAATTTPELQSCNPHDAYKAWRPGTKYIWAFCGETHRRGTALGGAVCVCCIAPSIHLDSTEDDDGLGCHTRRPVRCRLPRRPAALQQTQPPASVACLPRSSGFPNGRITACAVQEAETSHSLAAAKCCLVHAATARSTFIAARELLSGGGQPVRRTAPSAGFCMSHRHVVDLRDMARAAGMLMRGRGSDGVIGLVNSPVVATHRRIS